MKPDSSLKYFFIKLIAIIFAIIIVINVSYNLFLADKFEIINKITKINDKDNIEKFKNKLRSEIERGIKKDNILNSEDARLLIEFYNKINEELKEANKN